MAQVAIDQVCSPHKIRRHGRLGPYIWSEATMLPSFWTKASVMSSCYANTGC